jgi:pimeloyl-ACP methyl ester carboxylesterase
MIGTARSPRIEESTPLPGAAPPSAVVLVLHGGQAYSHRRTHSGSLAYLRMLPFVRSLRRVGQPDGVAVWLLRYRYRGWNDPAGARNGQGVGPVATAIQPITAFGNEDLPDPVRDTDWALQQVQQRCPGTRVALVGHSMGGRAALWAAGGPGVVGVCALAPWVTPEDPVEQLAGRPVLIAHGELDRVTDPAQSYHYALRARQVTDQICRFDVRDDGHAMLRRAGDWTSLVRRFVLGVLAVTPLDPEIAEGFQRPAPSGLLIPLPAPAG